MRSRAAHPLAARTVGACAAAARGGGGAAATRPTRQAFLRVARGVAVRIDDASHRPNKVEERRGGGVHQALAVLGSPIIIGFGEAAGRWAGGASKSLKDGGGGRRRRHTAPRTSIAAMMHIAGAVSRVFWWLRCVQFCSCAAGGGLCRRADRVAATPHSRPTQERQHAPAALFPMGGAWSTASCQTANPSNRRHSRRCAPRRCRPPRTWGVGVGGGGVGEPVGLVRRGPCCRCRSSSPHILGYSIPYFLRATATRMACHCSTAAVNAVEAIT